MEKKFITRIYRVAPSNGVNTISKVVKVVKTNVPSESSLGLEEVNSFYVDAVKCLHIVPSGCYFVVTSRQGSRTFCSDVVNS